MHIVCPHCSTSYAINPATLGAAGRTVRCSRCKEVWQARPEDAVELPAQTPEMADAGRQAGENPAAGWDALARQDKGGSQAPSIDSPSIAGDWPSSAQDLGQDSIQDSDQDTTSGANWTSMARNDLDGTPAGRQQRPSWLRRRLGSKAGSKAASKARPGARRKPSAGLPTACAAMGTLAVALLVWRAEVVRFLPQTAAFYKLVGLDVNLRGLRFRDVKVTTENVEGKPVLVIEGVITGESSKPVELPRLRFSVRDAQGVEIYAWNAVLEQPVLKPGERASFKSRLASPPPEGRNIDVRFFSKRDLAAGRI
jgi:predicted Zn finger-like uncharacterized protein